MCWVIQSIFLINPELEALLLLMSSCVSTFHVYYSLEDPVKDSVLTALPKFCAWEIRLFTPSRTKFITSWTLDIHIEFPVGLVLGKKRPIVQIVPWRKEGVYQRVLVTGSAMQIHFHLLIKDLVRSYTVTFSHMRYLNVFCRLCILVM